MPKLPVGTSTHEKHDAIHNGVMFEAYFAVAKVLNLSNKKAFIYANDAVVELTGVNLINDTEHDLYLDLELDLNLS